MFNTSTPPSTWPQPSTTPDAPSTTDLTNAGVAGRVHIDRLKVTAAIDHKPLGDIFYKDHPDYGDYAVASEAVGTDAKRKYDDPGYYYARSLQVRGRDNAYELCTECCPPMQLQGHNFFGHADVQDYAYTILDMAARRHGLAPTDEERQAWREGQSKLGVMHLCANFGCDPSHKPLILSAIDENNPKGKHRDWETCLSLGYGMQGRSQYHTATFYDKWTLLSIDWPRPGPLQRRLLELARNSFRIEIKLYSQWFREHGVDESGKIWLRKTFENAQKRGNGPTGKLKSLLYAMNWANVDLDALYFELLKTYKINSSIQRMLTDDEERDLSKGARRAYLLWLAGRDIKREYCRSTVHKYQSEIDDKFGVIITAARRPERLPSIDLADMLVPANILPIPGWAYGTPRYWPPGQVIAQDWPAGQVKRRNTRS
jgi:hypothetical protein